MNKNPHKKVVSEVMRRPVPTWPEKRYFVLECGHEVPQAGDTYFPKKCACQECGLNQRRRERAQMEALRR